jgi:ABC-type phosphate transport system substrate-binding protein
MKPSIVVTRVATFAAVALALGSAPLAAGAEAVKVDAAISAYEPSSGISGNLNSIGSDTLNNLMTLWAEGFQKRYPSVRIKSGIRVFASRWKARDPPPRRRR